MIEYMLNDKEHGQKKNGKAEAVCLLTAGEEVPGRKDVVAAGMIYFGVPSDAEDMAEALCTAAVNGGSEPIRRLLMKIWSKMQESKYMYKLMDLCMKDIKRMHEEAGEDEDQDEDQDEPVNPEFEELMRDNGIWREEDEDE